MYGNRVVGPVSVRMRVRGADGVFVRVRMYVIAMFVMQMNVSGFRRQERLRPLVEQRYPNANDGKAGNAAQPRDNSVGDDVLFKKQDSQAQ